MGWRAGSGCAVWACRAVQCLGLVGCGWAVWCVCPAGGMAKRLELLDGYACVMNMIEGEVEMDMQVGEA